jgi:tRNA (guanine-N7-)-methyltransferase
LSLAALEPYLVDVPHPGRLPPDSPRLAPEPPIDWHVFFGNDHPVEIEVGFGKGLFLLNQGQSRPDINFLGIEIERKYALLTATKLAKAGVANVKLACTDARWFLKHRVVAGSVAALHVYFPDPWWKNRHRKRKLFTRDFADEVVRVLQPRGRLHYVSDVADYFAESMAMLREIKSLNEVPVPDGGEYLTNFERKYRLEGRPIFRAAFEK